MTWKVEWNTLFSPSTDFVLPSQGCGKKNFPTKKRADEFAKNLRLGKIKVGPNDGQEIFGHELNIKVSPS